MAGVALGVNSISSNKYLDQIKSNVREPLLDEHNGRVRNVLVVDNNGDVWDSLSKDYAPRQEPDKSTHYTKNHSGPVTAIKQRGRTELMKTNNYRPG